MHTMGSQWSRTPVDILAAIVILFANDDHKDNLQTIWNMASVNSHWRETVLRHYCIFSISVPLHTTSPSDVRNFLMGLSRFKSVYTLYLRQKQPRYSEEPDLKAQLALPLPYQGLKNRGVKCLGKQWTLKNMPSIRRVLVEGDCLRKGIDFVGSAKHLTHLELAPCPRIRDYSPLKGLSHLVWLAAEFLANQVMEVSNFFSTVSSLESLKYLSMTGFPRLQSRHFSNMGNLHQLENFILKDCSFHEEHPGPWLSSLSTCHHLTSLTVSHGETSIWLQGTALYGVWFQDERGNDLIKSLRVAELSSLKELAIPRCTNSVRDVQDLSQLTNLTCLKLKGSPRESVSSVDFLYHIGRIETLKILSLRSFNTSRDAVLWENLSLPSGLTSLDLTNNAIIDDDLVHIGKLTQLRDLNLSDNTITGSGLKFLSRLRKLHTFTLEYCNSEHDFRLWRAALNGNSLASLSCLRNLTSVNVGYNQFQGCQEEVEAIFSLLRSKNIHVQGSPAWFVSGGDWGDLDWGDDWATPPTNGPYWNVVHQTMREEELPPHPHQSSLLFHGAYDHHELFLDDMFFLNHVMNDDDTLEDNTEPHMRRLCHRRESLSKSSRYKMLARNRSEQQRRELWRKCHGNKHYRQYKHGRTNLSLC